jgi:hypothetical protein
MTPHTYLSPDLRTLLENTVVKARTAAESGASAAMVALAVRDPKSPFDAGSPHGRLRNGLRARARQLGVSGEDDGFRRLSEEVAYVQWHRMLFARFLAENGLLVHPTGAPVSLAECAELAPEEGEPDEWMLAARYAAQMLPGIFPLDDPSAQVRFAPDNRQALEALLKSLPTSVFAAEDALGWVYQFWQTQKKAEVNQSGRKIGGEDISPVTQLFTEPYMVRFLLENSLGAWWAARHPGSPLVRSFEYLRFRDDGTPAAGSFPGWPDRVAKVTMMDPSCGSGHFLVVGFGMLRRMRMEEEGLSESAAAEAVLRDNLYGLELDPRCTQIAAFALAMSAWKAGGVRALPVPHVVCCGIPVQGQLETWREFAGGNGALRSAMERLFELFRNAPDLGSLINPASLPTENRMFTADYAEVAPLLAKALAAEKTKDDPAAAVFGAAARGVAAAAELLAGTYTLVATNVPYLGRKSHEKVLLEHGDASYRSSKADLSTMFVARTMIMACPGGSVALVSSQGWWELSSYTDFRRELLVHCWNVIASLGEEAWRTFGARGPRAVLNVISRLDTKDAEVAVLSATRHKSIEDKDRELQKGDVAFLPKARLLANPDHRISVSLIDRGTLLSTYADGLQGIATADYPRFGRSVWEVPSIGGAWAKQQGTVSETMLYGGRTGLVYWEGGEGELSRSPQARIQGLAALGRRGVAVTQMRSLAVTIFDGSLFDNNTAVILPKDPNHLGAVWTFCMSDQFARSVRAIDQKVAVTNATLVKVPFDLSHWQAVAAEKYPNGLPEPFSNDPTQWFFKGDPVGSSDPLLVAVARLLAYRWPDQVADDLDPHADSDGIVCVPAVARELPAGERLRKLLVAAWGDAWSNATLDKLLADAGYAGKSLDAWLRDGFFPAHCKRFDNRPFIWHIWDGHPAGFSALVNYHRLDRATLRKLTFTYLGDWIAAQKAAVEHQEAGAEGRYAAALALQVKLKAIEEGAPPFDIYVRWKPMHQQPIGWEPDINDGVRLNVRPFVNAGVLRSKFTVNWNKDRGANPDGSGRINDLHPPIEERRAARAAHGTR